MCFKGTVLGLIVSCSVKLQLFIWDKICFLVSFNSALCTVYTIKMMNFRHWFKRQSCNIYVGFVDLSPHFSIHDNLITLFISTFIYKNSKEEKKYIFKKRKSFYIYFFICFAFGTQGFQSCNVCNHRMLRHLAKTCSRQAPSLARALNCEAGKTADWNEKQIS